MMAQELPIPRTHDFGGEGPVAHLAHANGFPPGAYRSLAERLCDRFHVLSLLTRPLWPGSRPDQTPSWRPLAGDLVEGLDQLGLRSIVGVGHSLGGVLTLWAATDRPDLFRAVILIDPVILPPAWLWYVRLLRAAGLRQRQPLVQGALHRRRQWASREECYRHFREKAFFARWPDRSLWDYVESGTRLRPDGAVELLYPPEWEAHIFATVPTDIWKDVSRLRTPALILRCERSETFRPEAQARLARQIPQARFTVLAGAGHMAPMEQPIQTSAAIRGFLQRLDVEG